MTVLASKPMLHHWPAAPDWRLARGQIHLWCADLDRPASERARFEGFLSQAERERAARFRFERDRRRFVVRRGLLRQLLGAYLETDPARVGIGSGAYGKPELVEASGRASLRFNLSDSGPVALYAFALGQEVGVDVEELRDVPEADQIGRRFFSPAECAELAGVAPAQRNEAFLFCWTRKEAFLKAGGEGLFAPLDSFDVTLRPGTPAAVVNVRGPGPAAAKWSLHHLYPCAGYVGALAVLGQGWQLLRWRWDG